MDLRAARCPRNPPWQLSTPPAAGAGGLCLITLRLARYLHAGVPFNGSATLWDILNDPTCCCKLHCIASGMIGNQCYKCSGAWLEGLTIQRTFHSLNLVYCGSNVGQSEVFRTARSDQPHAAAAVVMPIGCKHTSIVRLPGMELTFTLHLQKPC